MGDEQARSRRALLTAAAGGTAALAANAVLGQSVVRAADEPLLMNAGNSASGSTGLTASLAMDTVFGVSNADATGPNTAIQGSSDTGTGLAGYTTTGTGVYGDAMGNGRGIRGGAGMDGTGVYGVVGDDTGAPDDTSRTGVFGYGPASDNDVPATGVWGDSPDIGVYGSGGTGVMGDGGATGWGLFGYSQSSYGLYVEGKVKFSTRSGRSSVAKGKTSYAKTVAGVTSGCIVIAVLQTAETGTWVRAAVAGTGKFTVYFNRALPSSTVLGWMILN